MAAERKSSARAIEPSAVVAVATMVAAWFVLTRPWLFGGETVPWDAEAHFRAQFGFLAHSIHQGLGIAWNPWIYTGWPQISDPQSLIFVPVFFLLALVVPDPSAQVMDAAVFVQLGIGGLALWGWFRDRGWHSAAGTVAALSFAFGGSAAWRLQHTGQVMSYALVPVVLFCLDRAMRRGSIWWGLWTGIAAGFLALGRDQIALLSIYFLIGHVVWEIATAPSPLRRLLGAIPPGLATIVGGLAVVTVPVVMTLLLAEHSNRPAIDFIGAGKGSLHPASLITAAIADLFGQGDQAVDYWGPPSPAFGVTDVFLAQNMGAIYAGAVPILALLTLGLSRGRLLAREVGWLVFATIFFVLYALGWYTPAFRGFYDLLPGVKLYRRPADATFLIGFMIAILGGHLVHRFLTDPRATGPTPVVARVAQGAILILIFAVLPVAFGLHADRLALIWKPLGTAIAFTLAAAGVLLVARAFVRDGSRSGATIALLLLAGFTTADLAWNNAPNESTAYPSATFDALASDTRDPVVDFLKRKVADADKGDRRDRVEMVGLGFHWPNLGMVHGLEHTLGYNPLRFKDYAQATGAIDHIAIPEQKTFSALNPSYDSTLVDLMGLRWIATSLPIEKIDTRLAPGRLTEVAHFPAIPGLFPAPGRPETWIYENPRALPRAFVVDTARGVDFAGILAAGRWPEGFDPRREVLLDGGAAIPPAAAADGPAGHAEITLYRNVEVVVSAEMARAGWLVFTDAWHRWWRVEVDGRPAELSHADLLFRAVRLEPGRHTVRMTFHPFAGAWNDVRAHLAEKQ